MITILQILFVLALIVLIIMLVFRTRPAGGSPLPENAEELLTDYVLFYTELSEDDRQLFLQRLKKYLSSVTITGSNAEVEDLDRLLIGAAAVIPVFRIPDWDYINLREVILYPGHFNYDYDQQGTERFVSGMVGNGPMQNKMILSKWELRQSFIHQSNRNTAIHEFVHLIDGMDGTLDGVPELLLERKFVAQWKALLENEMQRIRNNESDIDAYAATSPVECFAVIAEYFFTQSEAFKSRHPELARLMMKIFYRQ